MSVIFIQKARFYSMLTLLIQRNSPHQYFKNNFLYLTYFMFMANDLLLSM